MPLFIKNSMLYKLFDKCFIKPYNNSLLKKNLDKINNCFKQSFVFKSVERYLDKKPYFLNSFSYKIFRKFVKLIDKIMDFLHKAIKKALLGSNTFFELRSIKYDTKERNLLLISLLLNAFNFAYIIAGILLNTLNLYIAVVIMVVAFLISLFAKNKNCFKQSFIYKIFTSW